MAYVEQNKELLQTEAEIERLMLKRGGIAVVLNLYLDDCSNSDLLAHLLRQAGHRVIQPTDDGEGTARGAAGTLRKESNCNA